MLEGLVSLGAALCVLLTCRLTIMGSSPPEFAPADNPAADCDNLAVRTLTFLFLPAFNVWVLLCPITLSFDWSMEAVPLVSSLGDPRNLASIALYATLSAFAMTALFKRQRSSRVSSSSSEDVNDCVALNNDIIFMGIAILVLPFVPATNLFFYVGFVIAERILYIPSMGSCLLVAWGAQRLYSRARTSSLRRAVLGALVLLFFLFAIRTYRRNIDWATEENLYRSGIPINPPKGKIYL